MTGAAHEERDRCRDCGEGLDLRRSCRMLVKRGRIVAAVCGDCVKREDDKMEAEREATK